jgi:hypothetical protein
VALTLSYTKDGTTATDTVKFTVVGLGHIQCKGENVEDRSIVLLSGTIYTFTAIPQPAGAAWPEGMPVWSGLASGTGDQKQVTFDFTGEGYHLTATYGNSKTVTIDVIVPDFVYLMFISGEGGSAYHVHGKTDTWQRDPPLDDVNDPACFRMDHKTAVQVQFWHPTKQLTFDTPVEVRGDVHWLDEYITGEDYGRDQTTFVAGDQWFVGGEGAPVYSEANTVPYVDYDHDTDISWRYQVKSPEGTDEWIDTGDSEDHVYYIILDQPQAPQAEPWVEVLEKSCDWAYEESTAAGAAARVTEEVYDSGFEYDSVAGSPRFYDEENDKFDLTDCLGYWGTSNPDVNCWDCAQMVAIFSNALGADLQNYYITRGAYGFLLNYVKPIGRDWTNDPFTASGRQGFSSHWTAWGPEVYDACLEVDDDEDPTSPGHDGILPCNMTFNAGSPSTPYDDYRGKLVDPAHEPDVSGESGAPASVE